MKRTHPLAPLAFAGALALACAGAASAQTRQVAPPDRLAPPATTIADTVPPPPGVANLAWLSSLELRGEVADSLRGAFMAAFRGAFAEGAYATERTRDGRPVASLPAGARFRLIEGTSGWGVWNVQVVGEPLAGAGGRPGLRVTVAALSPQAVDAGARPIPARTTIALADDEAGGGPPAALLRPQAWWRVAGRATALLALERLHHLTGDLDADTRLALGPVTRVDEPAEDAGETGDTGAKPVKKPKARRY